MNLNIVPTWVKALLIGALIGLIVHTIYNAGVKHERAVWQAKTAKEQAAIAKANADNLRAAQSLSDTLSANLADAEATINKLTLEKSREIPHLATGNICFKPELTRLLNQPYFNDQPASQASSTPVAEGGAVTTTQEGIALTLTDEDVAQWVNTAQGMYGVCRERLNALIDFELKAQ